ncbi:MAG: class B sortase [Lachnospiraceae bacterium]
MNRKLLGKIIVYTISILVAGTAMGAFFLYKNVGEEKGPNELQSGKEAAEEVNEAMEGMSQEEIEALYDSHKGYTTEAVTSSLYTPPVDFEGMRKVNQDVYAWITIPGTAIDYPILQHETDNTYYLNHNIDGSYGYPGCIYTENLNSKDFKDNNTIIYGHNMKNGTMFADLHKYVDITFLEEHDEILIYTPEKELKYKIFAAYVYDDRHLLYSFDFADSEVYEAYLESVFSIKDVDANIRSDLEITGEDKIITLETCISSQPEKRLLVQAVLQKT